MIPELKDMEYKCRLRKLGLYGHLRNVTSRIKYKAFRNYRSGRPKKYLIYTCIFIKLTLPKYFTKYYITITMLFQLLTGKSSLMAALFRLTEKSGGSINVDGIDVSQVSLEQLRSRLSIITQDPVLFSGTIRYVPSISRHTRFQPPVFRCQLVS